MAGTAVVALANQRILSIMERGMLVGDGSLSARIAQGLTPIIAGVLQPLRLLVGFGAGNSIVAYLYLQFEGYAFYALPLLVWALRTRPLRIDEQA